MISEVLAEILTDRVLNVVADEAVMGLRDVTAKFACNYVKRRNVGYGIIGAAAGGFNETRDYYFAMITGQEPVEIIPAISFDK